MNDRRFVVARFLGTEILNPLTVEGAPLDLEAARRLCDQHNDRAEADGSDDLFGVFALVHAGELHPEHASDADGKPYVREVTNWRRPQ